MKTSNLLKIIKQTIFIKINFITLGYYFIDYKYDKSTNTDETYVPPTAQPKIIAQIFTKEIWYILG